MFKFIAPIALSAVALSPLAATAQQADTVRLQTEQSTQRGADSLGALGPGGAAGAAIAFGLVFALVAAGGGDDSSSTTTTSSTD